MAKWMQKLLEDIERFNEARNPANDEVNDIIRKHLAGGGSLTSKEKKVLNKYGITYDGRSREFSGTNKRFLTNGGKIGQGPKRGNNPSITTWEPVDIDNHTYYPKDRGKTWEGNPAYDDFDYANYLTKESDPDAKFYNMSKKERENIRNQEKEKDDAFPLRQLRHMPSYVRGTSQETHSMHKANHPYTPDYLDIKDDVERSQKHVKDANQYKEWAQNSLDQANQNMNDFRSRLPKNKR